MSPELIMIYNGIGIGEFNPESSDIYSLGMTFLRIILLLSENHALQFLSCKSGANDFYGRFIRREILAKN